MNIKHIQYMVEIERVQSISQAAENLYIGQPNLSRILKEVEESVGFPIFLRTSHGVRPTERGAAFLQHAHNILREMDSIQMMSPHQMVDDRLRVCIPRSAACFQMVADFLKHSCENQNIYAEIRECHAKKTLEFQEVASSSKLTFRKLTSYEDVVLMHSSHPLADRDKLKADELSQYLQIAHSDNDFTSQKFDENISSLIYTVDRQAQITLLSMLPNSYMWSVPQEDQALSALGLVQKKCSGYSRKYCEALIYNHQHTMNSLEAELLNIILANNQ